MKTCNYAVVRFLPYRETGEFVNVGVVLFCRDAGFFDVALETQRRRRVTDFFPELDRDLFSQGRQTFNQDLRRVKQMLCADDRKLENEARLTVFRELVRPRESVFRFSEVGTVLADDPAKKLAELFDRFVNRQFAKTKEYQETVMAHRLTEVLRAHQLIRHYRTNQKVGNDDFHVLMPIVSEAAMTGAWRVAPSSRWTWTGMNLRRFTSTATLGSNVWNVCGRETNCPKACCLRFVRRPPTRSALRRARRFAKSWHGWRCAC